MIRCTECTAPYPVLGGIPILVAEPHQWAKTYRDAVLASLAEAGAASRKAVTLVDTFASAGTSSEVMHFGDDWVEGEGLAGRVGVAIPDGHSDTLGAFVDGALARSPSVALLDALGASSPSSLGTCLEIGVGAGALSRALAGHSDHMIVADLSLRAVLRARQAGNSGAGNRDVAGIALDAQQLPFASECLDTIVAANVIDLLDDPSSFVDHAQRVLRPGGRLALTTPRPSLGGDNEQAVDDLLNEWNLTVETSDDFVPWLRPHGPRHLEIYFTRMLVARRG